MRLIVLCDADDVLYDTLPYCLKHYNDLTGENVKAEEITDWDLTWVLKEPHVIMGIFESPTTYVKVPLKGDAVEALNMLNIYFDVFIVTTGSEGVYYQKKVRYCHDFPFMETGNIAFCDNKGVYKGDVLIDDKIENHRQFKKSNPNGLSIVIDMPHNRHCEIEHVRVSNLSYAFEIIQDYERSGRWKVQ